MDGLILYGEFNGRTGEELIFQIVLVMISEYYDIMISVSSSEDFRE